MRTPIKLGLAALAAAMLLTSVASAGRLSITNQNIRATWNELIFQGKPERPRNPGQIRCAVTMEGSFHRRTIEKTANALVGYITRAVINHPCIGGEYYFHNGTEVVLGNPPTSLPWHLRYLSFSGTLPNITALNVGMTGMRMTANYGLFRCLEVYGSATEERTWIFNISGGQIISFQPTETPKHLIVREGMSMLCPEYGMLAEPSDTVALLGTSTTAISVTLI